MIYDDITDELYHFRMQLVRIRCDVLWLFEYGHPRQHQLGQMSPHRLRLWPPALAPSHSPPAQW